VAQGENHGAEIGTWFCSWGDLTEEEQDEWCKRIAIERKGNLLAGYATIHYHPGTDPKERHGNQRIQPEV
jgi:hypothetical protein